MIDLKKLNEKSLDNTVPFNPWTQINCHNPHPKAPYNLAVSLSMLLKVVGNEK
jgi:hypothetical protein